MTSLVYRPDYAKFVFELPRGLFTHYYQELNRESHECKFHGEWLKSHRVQALRSMHPDLETTVVEIWGEWAGIVRRLPWEAWGSHVKRFDARAISWDADGDAVLAVGHQLQMGQVQYNVEVFNSKPASKRHGRDRGGQGFRLGSRKSDICIVVYKRTGEPVAIEFRMQGQVLKDRIWAISKDSPLPEVVCDRWQMLIDFCESNGQKRLQRSLEQAGIGTYWPAYNKTEAPAMPSIRRSFAARVEPSAADLQDYNAWADAISGYEEPTNE